MFNRTAFKREARQAMRAAVPHFMLVALVYYLLTGGLSLVYNFLSAGSADRPSAYLLSLFLSCLLSLFGMVMEFGFCNYALRLMRREPAGIGSLFAGFSMAGRVIGLRLLVLLFVLLWALLLGTGLGVCVVVLQSVPGNAALTVILMLLLYLTALVGICLIVLRYAMAKFALLDYPNDGIMAAVRRSKGMMKRWTGKLFGLLLSFLGWQVLLLVIYYGVTAAGVYLGGRDWLLEFFRAVKALEYPVSSETVLYLTSAFLQKIFPYTVIAELVGLPLQLWLTTYQTCTLSRFYNYVGGYDYLRYMQARRAPDPQAQPEQPQATPIDSKTYYMPPSIPERNQEAPQELPAPEPAAPASEPAMPVPEPAAPERLPEKEPDIPEEPPEEADRDVNSEENAEEL